jgi:hypothetical protein
MTKVDAIRGVFVIATALTLLPSCAVPPSSVTSQAGGLNASGPTSAKEQDLLYVSTIESNNVFLYSYPTGKLVGTIRGFNYPRGLCTDAHGNVFITNFNGGDIIEYPHGGTIPKRNITNGGYAPFGCAIDPSSNNMAVTNYCAGMGQGSYSCESGRGNTAAVTVFWKKNQPPIAYSNPAILHFFFCGYDASGNLFVDGYGSTGYPEFELAELPKGGKSLKRIMLNQQIEYPGGVQWDGQYMTVGDYKTGIIYRFTVSGSHGTVEGSTTLDKGLGTRQYWIENGTVVGAKYIYRHGYGHGHVIGFWQYPYGGDPIKGIPSPYRNPWGIVISPGK